MAGTVAVIFDRRSAAVVDDATITLGHPAIREHADELRPTFPSLPTSYPSPP